MGPKSSKRAADEDFRKNPTRSKFLWKIIAIDYRAIASFACWLKQRYTQQHSVTEALAVEGSFISANISDRKSSLLEPRCRQMRRLTVLPLHTTSAGTLS